MICEVGWSEIYFLLYQDAIALKSCHLVHTIQYKKKYLKKKISSASPRPKSKMAAQKFENAIEVFFLWQIVVVTL